MIVRAKNVWDVDLIDAQTNQPERYVFEAYWDPTKDFVTTEKIAIAAAAEAGYVAGKIAKIPVAATLREPAEVVEING